ncbi:hypothetical protein [Dyadobacter bucti]|uniref:hypothetical protein n=1 Tax=Dyadobacter bucti TaxID=2572203 RepID=UPI0011090829|nr:hypothetical protein [Dyadobacter bucti]
MTIDKEITDLAIITWGEKKQLQMVREECLELAMAIGKYLERNDPYNPENLNNLRSEVADVNIMIQQANFIVGEEDVQVFIDQKLSRLKERINRKQF